MIAESGGRAIARVLNEVEQATVEIVDFAADLVRVPTVNPPGEAYETCARLLGDRLRTCGFTVRDLVPEDRVEREHFKLFGDLGRIDIQRLDLGFDVLLFIGQELVDLAVALNVGFALETRQSILDLATLSRLVCLKFRQQKNADIADGRFKLLDIFDKEQGLQNPNREGIVEVPLGDLDGLLNGLGGFERIVERIGRI